MIKNGSLDPDIHTEPFNGKLVVITGATSGIGRLVAKKYAAMGANLLTINRSEEKSAELRNEIESEFNVQCDYLIADLSRLEDMHSVAGSLAKLESAIDVLIFNAGIYLTKKEYTPDGIEQVLAVHYLSYFVITHGLLDKLKAQGSSRIIVVSSEGHRFAAWGLRLNDLNFKKRHYSGLKSYGSAKLAQLLSMLKFDDLFQGTGVTINAMHPGAVKTETGQENGKLYKCYKRNVLDRMLKHPDVSAEALYYLGVSPEMEGVSGKFFNLTTLEIPAPPALDKEIAEELWEQTVPLAKL